MAVALDFIDNRGPNSFLAVVQKLSKRARAVDWVVAFATRAGVEAVLPHLMQVARRGRVSVIAGFYLGGTDPQGLRLLLHAAAASRGRMDVRVARNPSLHRKVCIFRLRGEIAVLTGSSNLTASGLLSEGETNSLLRFPATEGLRSKLLGSIPELSSPKNSRPLTAGLISSYEQRRRRRRSGSVSAGSLAEILGGSGRRQTADGALRPIRGATWWREGIGGTATRRTAQVVNAETDWGRRGWEWYSATASKIFPGDKVLLFDFSGRPAWARLVVVKDVTRLAVRTPDGRHFIAHGSGRRGFRRRKITKAFWLELRAAGLTVGKSTRTQTRQLSASQGAAIESLFRKSVR